MAIDKGFAVDNITTNVHTEFMEHGRVRTIFRVERYDFDQTMWAACKLDIDRPEAQHFKMLGVRPYDVTEDWDCNLITNAGWNLFLKGKTLLSTDTAPTVWYDATHGRIGIGTSATAATYTDTALTSIAGMTGNNWILCGAAPTVASSARTAIFTASFGLTDAVGNWNEFAVDQGTASAASTAATAPMLNHGIPVTSTKNSSQTWAATVTLTFS